jgi:hypothetical protein
MGLTFVFCTAAINGFVLKSLHGGESKGPITKPFLTQEQIASVIKTPFCTADLAFLVLMPGNDFFRAIGSSPCKCRKVIFAIFLCGKVQENQHFWSSLIFTDVFSFELLFSGKNFQKSSGAICS